MKKGEFNWYSSLEFYIVLFFLILSFIFMILFAVQSLKFQQENKILCEINTELTDLVNQESFLLERTVGYPQGYLQRISKLELCEKYGSS